MTRCSKCGAEYLKGPHDCQASLETLVVERDEPVVGETSLYDAGAIIGSYGLCALLGEGGIGRVYQAEHLDLGRKVALKMVRSELAKRHSVIERFFGEARAVNQIQHENIVEITDFVREDAQGRSYYIMELLEGVTLRGLIDELGKVPAGRTVQIALQITSALQAVHEKGIVHRDLKPENIFLSEKAGREDFVKLLDFGVAKLSRLRDAKLTHETKAGALVGTPAYMAPEQTLGADLDHRADIYALGVVLYEMVAGRVPFSGDTGELLAAHRGQVPDRPKLAAPAISEALDLLIRRCLEKDPARRPQSMAEVHRALEALHHPRSRRGPIVGGAVAAALAAAAAFVALRPTPVPPVVIAAAPAPVESPRPDKVRVTFRSKPPGATVLVDRAPLGTTPVTAQLDRSSEPVTYELQLDGYASLSDVVRTTDDATVAVVLAEVTKPTPQPKKVRRKKRLRRSKKRRTRAKPDRDKIGLGDMHDPFADE